MFGGNRHSDSEDIVVFVCYMISQDHVIKSSCDLIGRGPSSKVTILPSLVGLVIYPMPRNNATLKIGFTDLSAVFHDLLPKMKLCAQSF